MRSTTKLMENWQFTGPDGKTAAVTLPPHMEQHRRSGRRQRLLARHLHLQNAVRGTRL